MTPRSILAAVALSAGALFTLAVIPGSDLPASAATRPVPCPDCIDANGPGGTPGLSFSWECEMGDDGYDTGIGVHVATAYVPRNWPGPVTFAFPAFNPPTVVVQPGESARMELSAQVGWPIYVVGRIFGSGVDRTVNKGPFNCPCDNLPPTTTTISPPSSVTSAPPASSTPGTTPGVTVPPSVTPGTQPFRLPDTGAGTWPLAAVGALAILAGAGALVIVRRRGEEQ